MKIALDARSLNNAKLKDKYQMSTLEILMEKVAEVINGKREENVWFTSVDMLYAYGQTILRPETAKHCNSQIIVGQTTGTYAFRTCYYGLTTMPPEFQKIMDTILHNTKNTFSFIDNILIVTKGTKEDHMKTVEAAVQAMNEAGVRLKAEKCQLAKSETEWLGYQSSADGLKPVDDKVQAKTDKLRPEYLKDLQSFVGAINHMNKFISNLANECAPFKPLLKQEIGWIWKEEHKKPSTKSRRQ